MLQLVIQKILWDEVEKKKKNPGLNNCSWNRRFQACLFPVFSGFVVAIFVWFDFGFFVGFVFSFSLDLNVTVELEYSNL